MLRLMKPHSKYHEQYIEMLNAWEVIHEKPQTWVLLFTLEPFVCWIPHGLSSPLSSRSFSSGIRTKLEDDTLQAELEGYSDYTGTVQAFSGFLVTSSFQPRNFFNMVQTA